MIETDWEKVWKKFNEWYNEEENDDWDHQKIKIEQLVYENTDNV